MKLSNKIEALLFWKGEPMTVKKIADILTVDLEQVKTALSDLKNSYTDRGFVLLENGDEFTLGTHPEMSNLFEDLQKEELNKSLSKASLETLSIILYKNGASRAEIDYVRGVNSGFTLRALSVRGLIEKVTDPNDSRKYLYKPTFDLLSYMGVTDIRELPQFEELGNKLNQIKDTQLEEQTKDEK